MENIHISNSKSLQIRQLSDINSPPHIHTDEEIEIMLIISGTSNCVINGTTYVLNKGDLAIVTRYQTHSYYHNAEVNTFSFIFQKNINEKLYNFFNNHVFHPPIINILKSLEQITPILNALEFEFNCETDDDLIYESFAQIIIKKIIEIINNELSTDNKLAIAKKSDFLRLTQQYCIDNHTRNLTVYDIAGAVGVHPNYLSSSFKKHFGITIIQYLNICRLQHAISIIGKQNLSITELSFASGFQSVRSFNRIFKKEMGCTPKEYQKTI